MKKLTKTFIALGCIATLSAGVCALAACGDSEKTGEAYGISHSAGYVAYATVTVKGDKITGATLTEVCFPDHNTYKDGETTAYYAKVTYGDVTMVYDATDGYKVGTQKITEFFQSEANCKAYYEAVMGNKISAYKTADGTADTTVMTKATLSKEENNYWMCDKKEDGTWDNHAVAPYSTNAYSRWKWNRDATVKYVLDNGVEGLKTLVKATEKVKDNTPEQKETTFWMAGGVSMGATWNDLNPANAEGKDYPVSKAGIAYVSYAQLLTNAYNNATK